MSKAYEHREVESLELNKETLQDLDVEVTNAGAVKGGAGDGIIAMSNPVTEQRLMYTSCTKSRV